MVLTTCQKRLNLACLFSALGCFIMSIVLVSISITQNDNVALTLAVVIFILSFIALLVSVVTYADFQKEETTSSIVQ